MPAHPLLAYWYMALNAPLGIYIRTGDVDTLRRRLHAAKHQNATEEERWALRGIQVRTSPRDPQGELWLLKGEPDE